MRYITIPPDITELVDPLTDEVIKKLIRFRELMVGVLHDPKWGRSMKLLRASRDIEQHFRDVGWKEGAVAKLSDDEHGQLCEIIENPSEDHAYNVGLAKQAVPLYDAVIDAPKEPPKPAARPPAEPSAEVG